MPLIDEFKALADKTRQRIINILINGDLCVCEIIDILEMTQSRISRHLGILKTAGLIEEERRGKWIIYKIADKKHPILYYIQQELKKDSVSLEDLDKMKKTARKNMCPTK